MNSPTPTRILFFLPCSVDYPSSQRRALDYEPYVRAAGIDPVYKSYTSPRFYHCWMTRGTEGSNPITRLGRELVRYWCGFCALLSRGFALLGLVAAARAYHGVVIQWVTPPVWITRWLKRLNPAVAFDFDDAVFLRHPRRTEFLIRQSAVVSTGSHYNLDYAQQINERAVFLPTPVPVDRFSPRRHNNSKRIIIGWIGSPSTLPDLGRLRGVLDSVAEECPHVELRIIGSGNRAGLLPRFRRIHVDIVPRIPYDDVPAAVAQFDIGVMPLREGEWEKGKCLGKMLEYMAAGVPAVVSRFGENAHAITDGVDGFLASSDEEWIDRLTALVHDVKLRERLGEAGRRTVQDRFSTEVCATTLIEDVLSRLTGRAANSRQSFAGR